MKICLAAMSAALLSACATLPSASSQSPDAETALSQTQTGATRIFDQQTAQMLLGNSGITLQWIGWDERGTVAVAVGSDGIWRLSASQQGEGAVPGRLTLDGTISEIGAGYFIFDGAIVISDTPDAGRNCFADKQWRFAQTQNRQYWRLREFEWCDGLTDYIDIYF